MRAAEPNVYNHVAAVGKRKPHIFGRRTVGRRRLSDREILSVRIRACRTQNAENTPVIAFLRPENGTISLPDGLFSDI